jgi:hypothetical protein
MTQRANSKADEFYVGYLPLPASYARMLRVALPAIILACALVAVLLGVLQRGPGAAVWGEDVVSVRGTLLDDPYPLVLTPEGHVVLLVEQGKHGARVGGRHAESCRCSGTRTADGRTILELWTARTPLLFPMVPRLQPRNRPAVHTLHPCGRSDRLQVLPRAMKPGDGKAQGVRDTMRWQRHTGDVHRRIRAAYLFTPVAPRPTRTRCRRSANGCG